MTLLLFIAGIVSLLLSLGVQLYAQRGGYQLAGFLRFVGWLCLGAGAIMQVKWLLEFRP